MLFWLLFAATGLVSRSTFGYEGSSTLAAEMTPRALTPAEAKLYSRVTYRPKGFRDTVWNRSKAADGNNYNPDGRILKFEEPWQLGHNPENKLSTDQLRAADEGWTREDWIRYQSDPDIYQPELPSTNECHWWEDDSDW